MTFTKDVFAVAKAVHVVYMYNFRGTEPLIQQCQTLLNINAKVLEAKIIYYTIHEHR